MTLLEIRGETTLTRRPGIFPYTVKEEGIDTAHEQTAEDKAELGFYRENSTPGDMADGYWNRQQPLQPSAGMLKRPRLDYGVRSRRGLFYFESSNRAGRRPLVEALEMPLYCGAG
ncbi:hypothetical protein F0562_027542 [Nyssa sinensis]|uniref:Uncharacterized protein n=1 Tax=Nyssa sinensis TaxID=561372 RepID=A0A5J5B5F2_9ASTE|nr:hypothetical protein F0562_027542 [Nyssa sinensis]